MKSLILIFFIYGLSSIAQEANNATFEQAYQNGVKTYLEKNYEESQKQFNQALSLKAQNISTLFNLALVEHQLGQNGQSLGLLRHALNLNPWYSEAQKAYEFIHKKMNYTEPSRQLGIWEQWHLTLWQKLPFWFVNALLLAVTLIFGILLVFLIRKYKQTEKWSWNQSLSLMSLLFVLSFVSAICKWIDQSHKRGTIVAAKVELHIGPDKDLPSVLELQSGNEVIIEGQNQDWVQVTYPGSVTGWIEKKLVYMYGGL